LKIKIHTIGSDLSRRLQASLPTYSVQGLVALVIPFLGGIPDIVSEQFAMTAPLIHLLQPYLAQIGFFRSLIFVALNSATLGCSQMLG